MSRQEKQEQLKKKMDEVCQEEAKAEADAIYMKERLEDAEQLLEDTK